MFDSFIISQFFLVVRSPDGLSWVLCLGSRVAKVRVSLRLASYKEALGRNHCQPHSGHWQNSVPFGCRTEVPVCLLAFHQGSFSAPTGCSHIPPTRPSPSSGQQPCVESCWFFEDPTGPAFKGLMWSGEVTQRASLSPCPCNISESWLWCQVTGSNQTARGRGEEGPGHRSSCQNSAYPRRECPFS